MGAMTRIDLQIRKLTSGKSAIGAGFVALDIVEGRKKTFASTGGSCGNVMAILGWLGWNAQPTSRLGADPASEYIIEEYNEIGVDTSHLILDETVSTPIVIQKFTETAEGGRSHRFSLSCPDCGGWLPRFRTMTLKQAEQFMLDDSRPQIYYFDRVTPSTLKLARWARDLQALVVFEPSSLGDEKHFLQALELCDVLKYSNDRLGHIPDLAASNAPKLIIETLGDEGLKMRWRGRWSVLPAFDAPVFEDAAGSGDWCTAGLLHLIGGDGAEGLSKMKKPALDRALKFGQALATLNCGFEGARGLMNHMDQRTANRALRSLIERGEPLHIDDHLANVREMPEQLCDLCTPQTNANKAKRAAS